MVMVAFYLFEIINLINTIITGHTGLNMVLSIFLKNILNFMYLIVDLRKFFLY